MQLRPDIPPPAGSPNGWLCSRTDVGYVPRDRMAVKISAAAAGVLVAGALLLAARKPTEQEQADEPWGGQDSNPRHEG